MHASLMGVACEEPTDVGSLRRGERAIWAKAAKDRRAILKYADSRTEAILRGSPMSEPEAGVVQVKIYDREYALRTSGDRERLRALCLSLDKLMREIAALHGCGRHAQGCNSGSAESFG